MSLLSVVQGACLRLNLPQPTAVVSTTDPQVAQLQGLLQDELEDLRSRHDWTALLTTVNPAVATLSNGIATIPLPADFQRWPQDSSIYHVQRRLPVLGPINSYDWQRLTVGLSPTAAAFWRRVGANLLLAGVSVGDTLNFEYVSANTIMSSGVGASTFQADTDTLRLPENLCRLGLVYRWRAAKGFDYAEAMADHERELERATAEDGGANGPISTTSVAVFGGVHLPPVFGA